MHAAGRPGQARTYDSGARTEQDADLAALRSAIAAGAQGLACFRLEKPSPATAAQPGNRRDMRLWVHDRTHILFMIGRLPFVQELAARVQYCTIEQDRAHA
jgi:hypothetical protein